jgi:hypothetical protein
MRLSFLHAITTIGIAALLAACGGRPDDAPAQSVTQASAPTPAMQRAASARTEAQRPPISRDAGIGELREEVALLRRDVADLREQLAHISGQSVATVDAPNPRTDAVARQQAQETERARIASSESAFRGERSDSRWSQATAATIQAALGQTDDSIRSQVRSIECRSQSCRVEINAGANGALAQNLPLIVAQLGSSLPHVTAGQIDQGDGRQATVLYLSR